MPAPDLTKANKWKEMLQEWHFSGLSGAAWCKEKGVAYIQFLYWRKRLEPRSLPEQPKPSPFIELPEESTDTWIEISLEGAKIKISKNFDRGALLFCLKVLGGH
jgi:hypothetical protein